MHQVSDLAAKNAFIALKTKVDKLGINKLVNVSTSLNNLKIKVEDLDVEVENCSCRLEKIKWSK